MPRRNRKETLQTIKIITRAAEHQMTTIGYDAMSYTTLSEKTGISRTGISHHFPCKSDFIIALSDKIYRRFIAYLNLDSDLNAFSNSWSESFSKRKFRGILKLTLRNLITNDDSHQSSVSFIENLTALVVDKFGRDGKQELERLMGQSILLLK
ncbi:TetR family transcriptional regulator [Vibrio sp. SCSIO 43137]|uniref:TetR family transcriptional regulator n=1 Tax=Vibrio sp. SCSIO 43137 TaxID=3021011 RepID=UPI0023079D97|nr:TetR family transcriptional regulator [Vibrio sp. SCSIO 43137]WCE32467.1 TetR family transcriptional regulator [Vibrio sp. SCSIO 43137]